ncbi:MAG: hypothetical protein ABI690_00515 [Chloroflexota bacterium]
MKSRGSCGIFFGVVVLIVLAIIALQPPPAQCLEYGVPELQAGKLPIPDDLQPLNGANFQGLKRIARLSIRQYSGNFDIAFSPDDSMLAISGVGYPRERVVGTFLWKLTRTPLCVLEVGDISVESYSNIFKAFSPDNRLVLLHQCEYGPGTDCYSLRYTQDNHLIARFYDAAFVRRGDEIHFEYQRGETVPQQIDGQRWQAADSISTSLRMILDRDTVRLIDPHTGRKMAIPVTGSGWVRDIAFSHNGKLLALAIMQRNYYAPYFWDTYVELWGVIESIVHVP